MVRPFPFFRLQSLAFVAVIAAVLSTAACGPLFGPQVKSRSNGERIAVTTWNLQALFDGTDDGAEYEDYRSSAGWNEERYRSRLDTLAGALRMLSEEGPDILALQEVESAAVLDEFVRGPLGPWAYRWSAFAALPGAPLGVGLVSRLPISLVRAHSITSFGETAPRPVLEVRVDAYGEDIVLFVCHWKSKRGGADETEGLRKASAQVVARRTAELGASEPSTPVIVLGDLNVNYDEFVRRGSRARTALMPVNSEEAAKPGAFLLLSSEKKAYPPRADGMPVFYSPWESSIWEGSFVFQGEWETIDHLLFGSACFNGTGWEFASFSVADGDPFVDNSGFPKAFNPRTGWGISDHLPLTTILERSR